MKVVRLEIGSTGASTPGMVHSTEVVEDQITVMVGW